MQSSAPEFIVFTFKIKMAVHWSSSEVYNTHLPQMRQMCKCAAFSEKRSAQRAWSVELPLSLAFKYIICTLALGSRCFGALASWRGFKFS